ncbi:MAG: DNA mismatch repair endonuclease MutL [Acidobacteriota bacterium]
MGRVRILPEVLARQIAAGEIVERPASVVKELVENSLDAEARSVQVEVEAGGTRRIAVLDDGYGMSCEDAQLALEHHATSKIRTIEDLQAIRTLGFRGEALPSIASVSRLRLRTVERPAPGSPPEPGTELHYEGGRRLLLERISWPKGTEVIVEDLFFNVPARKKFLRSATTELSHVSRLVTAYALAHPEVEFQLRQGKRSLIEAPPVGSLRERAYQLFGEALLDSLVPVEHVADGVEISGLASLPHEQRSNSNWLYFFVNGRLVRDRLLTYAVRQAYRDAIPAAAYPVAFLFIQVDPAELDVNVHPTKAEIRFRRSQEVFRALVQGIEKALLRPGASLREAARDLGLPDWDSRSGASGSPPLLDRFRQRLAHREGAELARLWLEPPTERSEQLAAETPAADALALWESRARDDESALHSTAGPTADTPESPAAAEQEPPRFRILGQFLESFIVAVEGEAILIVDQHVAHERVLFERALERLEKPEGVPRQQLLIPETLELEPQERAAADRVLAALNANGFDVEWFGETALVIRAVPAVAPSLKAADVVRDLLAELAEKDELPAADRDPKAVQRFREKLAVSLACRSAIKVNTPLSPDKMDWLLRALFRCRNPYTCPHGRPVVVRLTLEELLRAFHRL